ncbi:MAG: hypothetical protein ACLQBB_01320 [Solirubrobacteraceae bacterium]
MSLTLAIALNLIAAVALLGGLAWMMVHARKLTPHEPAARHLRVVSLPDSARVVVAEREERAA